MVCADELINSGQKKIALLIRHAERDPITSMIHATAPLLTESGKSDALAFGGNIAVLSPFKLYFSPVKRCEQTADFISLGIKNNNGTVLAQKVLQKLGGPYITGDWLKITTLVEKLGHFTFLRRWFNGELPEGTIMPLRDAALIMAGVLVDQLNKETCSIINVTHDWNIMTVLEYFLNIKHEDSGVPPYLDGLCCYLKDNEVHLIYNGHHIYRGLPLK